MSANSNKSMVHSINQEIVSHPAWYGNISGLKAEKLLRGSKTPYQYILRKGENEIGNETDYYVSFVHQDLTVRHQPFVITLAPEGWYYENGGPSPAYIEESIDDVIHLMMHCEQNQAAPLVTIHLKAN